MISKNAIGIVFLIVLAIAGLVLAQSQIDLKQKLAQLEQELIDAGYGWLVDYSGDDLGSNVSIEVYEENGTEVVAEFESLVDDEFNKVFLDGSSGVGLLGLQDTFDLLVKGGSIILDYIVDPTFGCGGTPHTFVDCFGTELNQADCESHGTYYLYQLPLYQNSNHFPKFLLAHLNLYNIHGQYILIHPVHYYKHYNHYEFLY